MPRFARDITWAIGRTPLVELRRLAPPAGARLLAKLESFNPTGSNKDRAVLAMIRHAEDAGFLAPGGTIFEASAGDLGISLAVIGRRLGYRVVLTMPECHRDSRCNLLRAVGAEIEFTAADAGIRGAIERADQCARDTANALCLAPFSNRANAQAHRDGTAREIWEDTEGEVDAVVVPVGTGGTAAGCAAFFAETLHPVRIIGVEPAASAVLSGGEPGPHDLPGLGAGFVPEILNVGELAEVVPVTEEAAFAALRALAADESILAGPASGAVLEAARAIAGRPGMSGRTVVAVLPDDGERYEEHRAFARLPHASAGGGRG